MQWLVLLAKQRSIPDNRLSLRLAERVPLVCSLARKRWWRWRTLLMWLAECTCPSLSTAILTTPRSTPNAPSTSEQFQLAFSANKRDTQSSVHCPNRHGLVLPPELTGVLHPPGQDTVIVSDTTSRFERSFGFAVKFISIGNFRNCPNRNLRRKAELLPYRLIALVMQVVLPKGFGFPGGITNKSTGGVGLFQRMPERVCLFGSGEQFDLCNQLHAINYSTIVLKPQSLKLFLLAFFDLPFDGFRAYVARHTHVIALCLQRCMSSPILAAKALKLLLQPARSNSIKQANNLSKRKLRRCSHKQMPMVGHDLNSQYPKPVFRGDFCQEFFQSRLDRSNQQLFSVAWYPDQMVVDYIHAVRGVVGFVWHRPILAKEGGSAR
jgi:hypothetical protein